MKTLKFDFNLTELNALLKRYPEAAHDAAEKELKRAALVIRGEAQLKAPKDLADLRGSAYSNVSGKMLKPMEPDSDPSTQRAQPLVSADLEAIIGFTEPYALIQHESLEFQHTDGEAKYLEKPYLANRDKCIKKVSEAVKAALEASKGGNG